MSLKDRILKKSNLWHVGAIALFIIVSCVYFSPALKGYTLKQPDIVNYIGMSREVQDFRDNNGEQVLWTNAMFAGMPATQISMKYENTWLVENTRNTLRAWLPTPIFFLFVYFLGFYILALSLRIKPLIGIVGAFAFGFSSYFIIILEAGHNSKAAAIGFGTFMIAGMIMAYRWRNWVLGAGLSALFMAVELYVNHFQITYYLAIIMLLIGIAELVRHIRKDQIAKFFKATGLLLVGYVFAVMVNYGSIFGTAEYAKQTIRGGSELTIDANGNPTDNIKTSSGLDRDYITNWSYGKGESFSLIVPNFKGGESQGIAQNEDSKKYLKEADNMYRSNIAQSNQYWGDQPFTSGPVYIGIIVMLLAALAMVYVRSNYKWALLSATLLALMLSWGKNYVSGIVLLPILLYNVNIFLNGKKQLIFTAANTLLLLFLASRGEFLMERSLTDFFLDVLPGYDKFRAVTIILVVVELCIPFLGVLFLQKLYQSRDKIKEDLTGFFVVSGVFIVLLLMMVASPTLFNTFISAQETGMLEQVQQDPAALAQYTAFFEQLENVRIAIFKADVLRSLLLVVLAIGIIFAYLKTTLSNVVTTAILGVLIFVDLFGVAQRYVNTDGTGNNYEQWTEVYNYYYPYSAGEGEQQILAFESQLNPMLPEKVDSAITDLNQSLKGKDLSARAKQLQRDYMTFRILNRNTNFRVFEEGNPFNSSYVSYFNKSIGGYHGAKLSRYQDLIEFHLSGSPNPAVLDMLNTKYFIRPVRDNRGQIVNSKLTRVNQNAMGNAWFAKDIEMVEGANEEIMAMKSFESIAIENKGAGEVFVDGKPIERTTLTGDESVAIQLAGAQNQTPIPQLPLADARNQPLALIIDSTGLNWVLDAAPDSMFTKIFSLTAGEKGGWDPRRTTVVDQEFAENLSNTNYNGKGSIALTDYHPDHLVYTSNTTDNQLAVFSEIYYEGWKAMIDGKEAPISRVNYVLRAVEVPAGEHKVEFIFEPPVYKSASTYALLGSLLIIALIIVGIVLEVKRDDQEESLDEVSA